MAKKPTPLEQRNELLVSLGECLDAWSSVELEIANLYMILHGVRRDDFSHPVRASYEAVVSLEVRLDMILAYAAADGTLEDYYLHANSLVSRVKKLYKKRHEAAHFKTVTRIGSNNNQLLIRPFFSWSKFLSNEGTELSAKQLRERAAKFNGLLNRIIRHIQHVGTLRKLPLEHFVQAGELAFQPLGPADLTQSVPGPPHPPSAKLSP